MIHNDLKATDKSDYKNNAATSKTIEAIAEVGLTVNRDMCIFGKGKITFCGIIILADEIQSDPEKVKAPEFLQLPNSKD